MVGIERLKSYRKRNDKNSTIDINGLKELTITQVKISTQPTGKDFTLISPWDFTWLIRLRFKVLYIVVFAKYWMRNTNSLCHIKKIIIMKLLSAIVKIKLYRKIKSYCRNNHVFNPGYLVVLEITFFLLWYYFIRY